LALSSDTDNVLCFSCVVNVETVFKFNYSEKSAFSLTTYHGNHWQYYSCVLCVVVFKNFVNVLIVHLSHVKIAGQQTKMLNLYIRGLTTSAVFVFSQQHTRSYIVYTCEAEDTCE